LTAKHRGDGAQLFTDQLCETVAYARFGITEQRADCIHDRRRDLTRAGFGELLWSRADDAL
jgi:hypothetical protein